MRLLFKLILVALVVWGVMELRSPYRTALLFGTDDLSSVQAKLDKLPWEDRDLVVAYVKRSRGDVLLPSMADPDEPLTARTFAEAIELQRKFVVYMQKIDAQAQARRAARDAKLAPLRAALSLRLIKREIMTVAVALEPPREQSPAFLDAPKRALSPTNGSEVLVATYRLRNISGSTIASAKVSVTIRKAHPRRNELGILGNCYIEHSTPLVEWDGATIRCSNLNRPATAEDRAFAEMDESQFVVDYEPRLIRFADGRELKFND